MQENDFHKNLFGHGAATIGTQACHHWLRWVKTAMTMTEKIFARSSKKTQLSPGENVWVNVDTLMTHDVSGPGSIGIFKKEFGENAKVWDKEKIVIIPDHYIFTRDERANRNVDILRDFCMEQNIKYFYDIKDLSNFKANPDYKGVCHIALAQGHCRPGEVLLGTDSHTCTAGAFGQFATGIGNMDAGFVLGTGKLLLKGEGEDHLGWESLHTFSVKRYYRSLTHTSSNLFPWKMVWKAKVPPRVAFFSWIASLGKALTIDNLRKRGLILQNWCCLCQSDGESVDHGSVSTLLYGYRYVVYGVWFVWG
uniref:Aconitase/3-isopropylmalate dehydratase large subunit alpha/beta/alpha domain-containing protein n=1 Tax=Fagus sylvatica TaxID=28930 RepID=A0A2N9EUB2_FAGSY